MEFTETYITDLDLTESPENVSHLIIKYLCGESIYPSLLEDDKILLKNLLIYVVEHGLNYSQFNELLLLLNQDIVTKDFFIFIFKKENINLEELKYGIIYFRGFAMLCFGNFRFAYKTLYNKTKNEIEILLSPYCKKDCDLEKLFEERPIKMLEINKIPKYNTWLLGYVSGMIIEKEAEVLRNKIRNAKNNEIEKFIKFSEYLQNYDIENVQKKAYINTDIYLTWDYMDIYIATSMRNEWEYEETYDFIQNVFNNESLTKLKLRYFDPTQSKCGNSRDKGLIEGLMLKRALCTIYLAQESDTMGKDSELAATLAQSKPVIAYVPKHIPEEYSKKIYKYPLKFFKKRFLILDAEEIFEDEKIDKKLKEFDPNYLMQIDEFLSSYEEHRKKQPFTLWKEEDEVFKKEYKNFKKICYILSELECYNFDRRADLLKGIHPLSMQVDLQSGVANGVLVVRSPEECVKLLYRILTNKMKFIIKHYEYENEILSRKEGYTVLIEEISNSPFRVVTDQERLTNSFWNLFHYRE